MVAGNLFPVIQTMMRRLGKLLFPHLPRDQRKRNMRTLTLVLAAVAIAMLLVYEMHR